MPENVQNCTVTLISVQFSCSVVSNYLRPHGLQPTRLLGPWDFPGKAPDLSVLQLISRTGGIWGGREGNAYLCDSWWWWQRFLPSLSRNAFFVLCWFFELNSIQKSAPQSKLKNMPWMRTLIVRSFNTLMSSPKPWLLISSHIAIRKMNSVFQPVW